MADPTYEADLILFATFIAHSAMTRQAVCTYAMDRGTNTETAAAWAQHAQDHFAADFGPQMDNNVSIVKTTALLGDGTSTFTTGESTSAPVVGGRGINSLLPSTSVLIKKVNGLGGRSNRGRLYLPWAVGEGEVDETGVISPSVVATLQTAATAFKNDFHNTVTGTELVIAQRFYDLPWDNPMRSLVRVEGSEHVTALQVETMVATQRRRMPRS